MNEVSVGRRNKSAPKERAKAKVTIGRRLFRLVFALAVLVAAASLTLTVGTTVWAKVLHGGAQVVVVTSNSMVPEFAARDILAVRPIDPADLEVGDIVTMKRPSGTLVTHRIIDIEQHGEQFHLHTQGDANDTPDVDIALGDQVLGVVDGMIPRIGEVAIRVQTRIWQLATLAPAALIIVGMEVVHLWRPRPEDETENRKASDTDAASGPTPPVRSDLPALPKAVPVPGDEDSAPVSKRQARAQAKAAKRAAAAAARQAADDAKIAEAVKVSPEVSGETDPRRVYVVVDPTKPRGRHRAGGRAPRRR